MIRLGERLRHRRKELRLTQKDVSKAAGVSAVSVTLWEKSETYPKGKNLIAICKILKCSPDWLLDGQEKSKGEPHDQWNGFNLWDENTPLGTDEVEVGFYIDNQPDNAEAKVRFSKSTLTKNGIDPINAACVMVSGNSMEPVIPHGSTIGVDKSNTKIIDGKIYAIDHAGMFRLKIIYNIPGGGVRLRSYNKIEHPDETLTQDEYQKIKIIGKLFWYSVLV